MTTAAVIVGILCLTYNGGVQSGGVRCSTSIAVPGGIIGSGNYKELLNKSNTFSDMVEIAKRTSESNI